MSDAQIQIVKVWFVVRETGFGLAVMGVHLTEEEADADHARKRRSEKQAITVIMREVELPE